MRLFIISALILLTFQLSGYSQSSQIVWGAETTHPDGLARNDFFRGPDGKLYGIEEDKSNPGLEGITLLRFDVDMSIEERKPLVFEEHEDSYKHHFVDICTWGGEITVLSYQITGPDNDFELSYSVVDPLTLTLSRELIPIITYSGIPAQHPALSRYISPLEFNRSNNCNYFVGTIRFDSGRKREVFIIGSEKSILWQSNLELDISYQWHISNNGVIAADIRDNESLNSSYEQIIQVIDPHTSEIESHVLGNHNSSISLSAISVTPDGSLILAEVIQQSNSAVDLAFFVPEIHENPIITALTQEDLKLIQGSARLKNTAKDIELKLFATYRKNNGSVIALFQRRVSDSRDEILAISIQAKDGTIEWIRKLARKQAEYSPDRDLPITFYQDGILHLYCNKGAIRKSVLETQDPWMAFFSSQNGGAVYHLSISDEGEVSEEIAEKLHKGSYWRPISISSNAPERTLFIYKQLLEKEKLGTISFNQ